MRKPRLVMMLSSLALLLAGCNFSLASDVTPPPGYRPPVQVEAPVATPSSTISSLPLFPLVPPDPSKGEAIFLEKCTPCHGSRGLGDGPRAAQLPNPVVPLGTSEAYRGAAPARWFNIVTQGNLERFMPPFPSLSDRERWDVIAYALSMGIPAQDLAQGAALFQENCARCHGARGQGDGPQTHAAIPDFSNQEFMAGRSAADFFQAITNGAGKEMPAFGEKLSDNERWALSAYLRSLSFASTLALAATPYPAQAGQEQTHPTAPVGIETVVATATVSSTVPLGVISGKVTDAAGDPAPAGLQINLHAFDQMSIVFTDTTSLKEDGTYAFENVEMPDGRGFLTTLEYGGVAYGSDIALVEGNYQIELPIEVFQTTTDPSALVVDRLHYFFDFLDENTLQVFELYIISNPISQTLVAAQEGDPVVTFPLPPGATNLQFQDGELGGRYVPTEGGFGDTAPVRPGSGNYQVVFSYEMPYDRKLELVSKVNLPTRAVVILAPAGNIRVKGDSIQDAGVRDMQGVQYQMYDGGSLEPGDELRLTITGKPASSAPAISTGSASGLVLGVGAFGLALVAAGVWLYLRNKPVAISAEGGNGDSGDGEGVKEESAESIMDAILALDDLYQQGKLPEEAYLQRRAQLKASLKGKLGETGGQTEGSP